MAAVTKRILLVGGHGKVSLFMTPHLLARGWHVTSLIRNPEQKGDINAAAGESSVDAANLSVLVKNLEDIKSLEDAKRVLDQANVDTVVWSAGAGGKGGVERTYAIDRDAAKHFISAALSTPTIHTFMMVSALIVRRNKAPWWSDEDWEATQRMNSQVLPDYYKAKLVADEYLTVLAEKRVEVAGLGNFRYLVLRPGIFADKPASGRVSFGKTESIGTVSREDVAQVAAELLERSPRSGWFDLLSGNEILKSAVERVVREGIDSRDGEILEVMAAGLQT